MKAHRMALSCALAVTASASAQNIYITDQATYTSGLTDFAVEDFNDGPTKVKPDGTLVFDAFTLTSNFLAGASIVNNTLVIGGASNSDTSATVGIHFDRPVSAIGMNILDIAIQFHTATDDLVFYQPSDFAGANPGDFGVIEFSEPVTQITLFPAFSFSMWLELDNLVIAYASPECVADTNGDGMLSPADFSAWVAAFNTMAPACDQNSDGACTPADFSAWVANYNAGC